MIISHPVLNRFSPSIREVTPEIGDDTLEISPSLQLMGLPPEPTNRVIGGSGNLQESSFILSQVLQITNSGALLSQIVQCRPGYWRLFMNISYISNFLGTLQSGEANIGLDDGTGTSQVLTIYGNVGVQSQRHEFELMASRQYSLSLFLSSNTVGQDHRVLISIVGNKLL